jgi:GAF domain-containing protein
MASPSAKRSAYQMLKRQLDALLSGERDWLANLSQFAALVFDAVPDLNWAGFYLARDQQLVLGPFQGKVACVRIAFDQGVCGAAARSGQVQIVPDVHAFEGHIACDSASRSELVVPVFVAGNLRAVFDLDSPLVARFDEDDAYGIKQLLEVLIAGTDWP